jgi:hypothetical protein
MEIEKPGTSSLQALEPEPVRKAAVIRDYIEKYALIEAKATTPELLNVYFEALEHFDLRRIEKGLRAYLQKGTRWPWPGTLAEWIEEEI